MNHTTESGPVDFARLRRQRRDRVFETMACHGLDALVLGRESNVAYVTGARRLWTSGARSFSPTCVAVATTRQVHLMSISDDGVPDDIGRESLFGISWNPANHLRALTQIPGLSDARRIGVDAMTPLYSRLFAEALPEAVLVDAMTPLLQTRRTKTADEVTAVRLAIAAGESCMSEALAGLRPGVGEAELVGRYLRHMGEIGTTTPAQQPTFSPAAPNGVLVVASGGVMYEGYQGSLVRTWPAARADTTRTARHAALYELWQALWSRLAAACRPGHHAGEILDAHRAASKSLPSFPVVMGLGLGVEPPFVGEGLAPEAGAHIRLEPGMVVSIGGRVLDGDAAYVASETLLVTENGHEILTSYPHRPLWNS